VAGHLFVIAGPSGVGKSTLEKRLLAEVEGLAYSVSATTRQPRPGEVDGRDYFFVSPQEFKRMIDQGQLAEWAEFFGHCYGTPARFVTETLASGQDLLIDVEVEGLAQLKKRFGEAVYILVLPPSMAALKERLKGRATEDDQAVAQRPKRASWELERLLSLSQEGGSGREQGYDWVIVNDDLETAYQELKAVVLAARAGSASKAGLPDRTGFLKRLAAEVQ